MKVRIVCHARWEIPFEFFSLRNYFKLFVYYFIFWFSKRAVWWTGWEWVWRGQPFPFFLALTLTPFVSFCWSVLRSSGLMKENFFFFLDLCCLSSFFVEEISSFSDTLFAGSSLELSPASSFFYPTSSLELTTGKEHLHHVDLYAETQHLSNFLTLFTVSNIYP